MKPMIQTDKEKESPPIVGSMMKAQFQYSFKLAGEKTPSSSLGIVEIGPISWGRICGDTKGVHPSLSGIIC